MTKSHTYDVAEQLRTPEEVAAYLDAWLTEAPEDVVGIARALRDVVRAKGIAQVAHETGLKLEGLCKALNEPLSSAELAAYEARRDLAAELLQSIREMKAGPVHVVLFPVTRPYKK